MNKYKLIILILITYSSIFSINVSLSTEELNIDSNNTITLGILNQSNTPKAFEISIENRTFDEKGNEKLEEETNDFLIIPAQQLLPPNTSSSTRITCLNTNMENEKAYRVFVKEIDLNLDDNNPDVIEKAKKSSYSQIKVLTNIAKYFHVTKNNFNSDITLNEYSVNSNILETTIENKGTEKQYFIGEDFTFFYKIIDQNSNELIIPSSMKLLLAKSIFKEKLLLPEGIKVKQLTWFLAE